MTPEESQVRVEELAALGKLFEEHRAKLLNMVRQRLDSALAARLQPEDVLAQAFLRARGRWQQFQQSGMSGYAWLYRIVLDCLYDEYDFNTCRRRDLRLEVPWPDGSTAQLGLHLVGDGTTPSEALARKELQERMRRTLEMLKPDDHEILCMRFFDLLTTDEMAAVLGLAPATVRQRYARALRRLKELWKNLYGPESLSG